jgi:enoyl-CoA hydratase/carnithine racemase
MRMNRMDKVFVAAVNGIALGGGCELALACDIRLMADGEGHRIGLPEMTLGLIPGAGGTQRLARSLGPARALELILEGRALSPREAAECGLVHRVVGGERLLPEARSLAARMAKRSPLTVAAAKRAIYEGGSRTLAEGMHGERAGFLAAVSSPPALRAMSAYRDRVAALPEGGSPWAQGDFLRPWQEGDAVDLISG